MDPLHVGAFGPSLSNQHRHKRFLQRQERVCEFIKFLLGLLLQYVHPWMWVDCYNYYDYDNSKAPGNNHVTAISSVIFKYVRIQPNFASRPVSCEKTFLCCFFPQRREKRLITTLYGILSFNNDLSAFSHLNWMNYVVLQYSTASQYDTAVSEWVQKSWQNLYLQDVAYTASA